MDNTMKSVAFHNLGCKVNGYEMDYMQQNLQERGYIVVPFDTKADIYIINTCSVTNMADRKSRQMIHRAKKMNPDAVVVAVGCYVQTSTEEVLQDLSIPPGAPNRAPRHCRARGRSPAPHWRTSRRPGRPLRGRRRRSSQHRPRQAGSGLTRCVRRRGRAHRSR